MGDHVFVSSLCPRINRTEPPKCCRQCARNRDTANHWVPDGRGFVLGFFGGTECRPRWLWGGGAKPTTGKGQEENRKSSLVFFNLRAAAQCRRPQEGRQKRCGADRRHGDAWVVAQNTWGHRGVLHRLCGIRGHGDSTVCCIGYVEPPCGC